MLREELAAPVLVLNLVGGGDSLCDLTLRAHADAGEPARLALRQLVRHPPHLAPLRRATVRMCEDPAVVSSTGRAAWGAFGAAGVCRGTNLLGGADLLRQLRQAGAELAHNGDFDWGGLQIANLLARRYGRGAVALRRRRTATPRPGPRSQDVRWRPSGTATSPRAMRARGVPVHEEQVLDDLLADLDLGANSS